MTNTTTTTMQINPDYFVKPTAHRGIVSHCKNVHGYPTRKSKTECWRVWVRIKTDEGWTLMGYIGNATDEKSLPTVKKGDRVEVDPIILCGRSSLPDRDERPRDFDRQLTGKILRAPRVVVPSAAALGANPITPIPTKHYEDFAMPPVFALITADGNSATIFVPNPWASSEVRVRYSRHDDDGIWRFQQGKTLDRNDAVKMWNTLVGEGCNARDIIENPLNDSSSSIVCFSCCDADEFASNFCMKTTSFGDLIRVYGGYPRKTNA